MSASTITRPANVSGRLSFGGILRSEWIKLTSLRSTMWSYGLIVLLSLGFGILMATTFTSGGVDPQGNPIELGENAARGFALTISTMGLMFGQLIAGVLGVLMISGEYSTGMIRSTLTAVPSRLPALWAKAIVLFVTTTAVGLLTVLLVFAATAPARAANGLDASLLDPEFALALLGGGLYLGLVSVFALGLGTLIRSSAGGIAASLGAILVLPVLASLLAGLADWAYDVMPYLISNAGQAMFTIPQELPGDFVPPSATLSPGIAALVVLAWAVVALGLGALALRRRDA